MRKVLDVSKILGLGWAPKFDLARGLEMASRDYLQTVRTL
jgi:nucleoside-diphosphate-sugar epimerase